MRKTIIRFLQDEDGFLSFLGGLAAKWAGKKLFKSIGRRAVGSLVGGAVNRFNNRQDYKQNRKLGFTHSEISGAGGISQGGSEAVMGNQANQFELQRMQLEYDEQQRDKDRAVAMRGQDAGLQSAQLSSNASIYSSDTQAKIAAGQLALRRDEYRNIHLPESWNRQITEAPSWKRAQLLAQMGVDNMVATVIASVYGVDPTSQEAMASIPLTRFKQMVRDIYGLQSRIFREGTGFEKLTTEAGERIGRAGRAIMGGQSPFPKSP